MPWASLQGFVRTAGCTLRRLCLPEVALLHLHLYHVLTDNACADALCILLMSCFFIYFSSVIFPHAVFIVRKFTVISIAPIQYCLAHLKNNFGNLGLLNCIDVHFVIL